MLISIAKESLFLECVQGQEGFDNANNSLCNERAIFILKQIHSILKQMDGMKSYCIRLTFLHTWHKTILDEGMLAFFEDQTYY